METFPHGIHPKGNKARSANAAVSEFSTPEIVAVPLSQHAGKAAIAAVSKGDYVKVGQKLGEADGAISAAVFSSVSVEVTAI